MACISSKMGRTHKLRIALVSSHYYPHVGGVSEHVYNLWRQLKRRGHFVKIITGRMEGTAPNEYDVIRVGKAMLFPIPLNLSFSRFTIGGKLHGELRRVLKEGKFDIVHIHEGLVPFLPLLTIRYSDARKVLTFHAGFDRSLWYGIMRPILEPYFNELDAVIAVSEVAVNSHRQYFPGKYRVIPNGVDVGKFQPTGKKVEALLKYKYRMLFVGRLEPRSGLPYLLKAMTHVVRAVPEAVLVVVGEGPYRYKYQRMVPPHVAQHIIWCGRVLPEFGLPCYYRTADLFVAPSPGGHSFGITLLEAMSTGIPVVASSIPGYRQLVDDGETGLLVLPGDVNALAEKIIMLLHDTQLRHILGSNGRRKALRFAWDKVADAVERVYYELV